MEISKVYLEEHLLIKYYGIKRLVLLKVKIIMDINVVLFQWFVNVLIKNTSGSAIKNYNMSDQQLTEELHKRFIRKIKKKKRKLIF